MTTKKIAAALMALAISLPMAAQHGKPYYERHDRVYADEHNIYYGLRLGLALANVNSDDDQLDGSSMQAGLNVGGVIGFQLSPSAPVYLESGLFYTQKGGKGYVSYARDGKEGIEKKKFTYDLNYLEMPILVKYKYELDDDLSIQPFVGGYLALGVGGKVKNYADRNTSSSFSNDFFKRFDGGLRLGCGLEYQVLYADIAYEFGLANICHSDFDTSRNV